MKKLTITSGLLSRKFWVVAFSLALVLGILPQAVLSQEITHSFKITGQKKIPSYMSDRKERIVEYDPNSVHHLYIIDVGVDGFMIEKTHFLFKGEKFKLLELGDHIKRKELLRDGTQTKWAKDQSVTGEWIFKMDTLLQQTNYYGNGNKRMLLMGDEKTLNGAFKMWYPDGRLSFSGNYKNNLKHGSFESFDESGNSERKGIYEEGKLVSGESVVQDFLYDAPEVSAQYIDGEVAFNEYLKMKTADFPSVKEMDENWGKEINLNLTINKTGGISKMEINTFLEASENGIINAVFKGFPGFKPALMEGVPVRSTRKLDLFLSNQGLQTYAPQYIPRVVYKNDSINQPEYSIVEELPEFPGGDMALRQWIANNVTYPNYAQEHAIQGKVYVSFVIREDGSISNITIARSVHPSLDVEAVKLVMQMPKWKPGRHDGKAVRVSYTVPINFVIQ